MSREAAEALLARIEGGGKWPLDAEAPILTAINTWAALRESNKDALKIAAGWTDRRREYRVDPLPERIADAWASFLVGEEPRVTPAAQADVANLEALLEANDFASELERAAGLCVSEGEIWPRIYLDPVVAPHPLLDWVSRRNVIPLWVGPRLAAAAVVTELRTLEGQEQGRVFRHFEVHAPGVVLNALYAGKADRLGRRATLDSHADTATLEEAWDHGLAGMLIGRIPNRLRGDRRLGVSDYAGILDTLLDLNEAAAIGAHNARLTARKRAVVSASAVRNGTASADGTLTPEEPGRDAAPRARFDASEEVFIEDPLDAELGRAAASPFRVLEYSFDAEALIAWKRDLVETALTRVGLTAQYVTGHTTDGYAISGTALRLRLIPTDKTGRAKARYWDDAIPKILATMAQLEAAPTQAGGLARGWADAVTPPTFERRPGLPADEAEQAQTHAALVGAGLLSVETALKERYPEWDDDRVAVEVERIKAERPAAPGGVPIGF